MNRSAGMRLKSVTSALFLLVLIVSSFVFTTGANTDRMLTGGYVNAAYQDSASGDTLRYMRSDSLGATFDASKKKVARWWTFTAISGQANIHVFSPSIPGWAGYSDTTASSWALVIIPGGGSWNSEGLPIYAWKYKAGGAGLQIIARD